MSHYTENRKFAEEMDKRMRAKTPKKSKIIAGTIIVPTVATAAGWTDGAKWVCDTTASYDHGTMGGDVIYMSAPIKEISKLLKAYPHEVGTFLVIADHVEVAKLIRKYPHRDIKRLLLE